MTIVQREAQWRAIPGYAGQYDISSNGDVLSRLANRRRILKPSKREEGFVVVLRKDNTPRMFALSRLMLLAFKPLHGDPRQWVAKPKNGDVHDMRLENWQWVRKQTHRKLTAEDVRSIRARYMSDMSLSYPILAKEYGVSVSAIAHIFKGTNWNWLD